MVTPLSRLGGRRYRNISYAVAIVVAQTSNGSVAAPSQTVAHRRYPQATYAPNGSGSATRVRVWTSVGVPAGGGGGGGAGGYSLALVVNNPMSEALKQSTARNKLIFMVTSTDHITGKTGISGSMTIYASKDGGASALITPTVTEIDSTNMPGVYNLALTSSHTNTLGDLAISIAATGADPLTFILPVEVDRPGASVATVTGNVSGSIGSISGVTFPSNFALLSIDANGRAKTQTGIAKNTALAGFPFLMTDSSAHNPKTGATVTGTVSLDGASFGSLTNSVVEVGAGYYKIDLAANDVNGNNVALRFTASGCDDTDISFRTSA